MSFGRVCDTSCQDSAAEIIDEVCDTSCQDSTAEIIDEVAFGTAGRII